MDDDKLKSIFASYSPTLSDDSQFMHRIEQNLHAISLVKQDIRSSRLHQRLAMIAATLTGFILGVVTTIAYPWLCILKSSLMIFLTGFGTDLTAIAPISEILFWTILCAIATLITLTVYDLTPSLCRRFAPSSRLEIKH